MPSTRTKTHRHVWPRKRLRKWRTMKNIHRRNCRLAAWFVIQAHWWTVALDTQPPLLCHRSWLSAQISLHFKHIIWNKTPSNAKHTHQSKLTRVAAKLTTEIVDFDKYTGVPVVWLLDLSYKLTDRQWLSTHNHPFSVADCNSALRRYVYYDLGYVHSQMS